MSGGVSAAAAAGKEPRIGLLGPFSSRNLGDTATQIAVMQEMQRRIPNASFVGIAPEPDDTLRSLQIPAFPLSGAGPAAGAAATAESRGPWARTRRMLSLLGTLDLLIVSGGGQLDDFWGGPWAHPWSMLSWAALARYRGVPVSFLAVGVDKLDSVLSRRFCVWAMHLAQHRTFRDAVSRDLLVQAGLSKSSTVCPDVVFALAGGARAGTRPPDRFVVLNPISHRAWSHTGSAAHARYIEALVAAGVELALQGYALRIVCSQASMDGEVAQHVAQTLHARGAHGVEVCEAPTAHDFLRTVTGAEAVVASRLHGVILSLLSAAPTVALSHLPKVTHVMQSHGLADFCLSLHDAAPNTLQHAVRRCLTNTEQLRAQIQMHNDQCAQQLRAVFDDVAQLLPIPRLAVITP
jgi:polysaccharide pyruvyl transferase WcaK-like protein